MEKIFNYNIDEEFGFSTAIIKGQRKFYVEGYASTIVRDKSGEIVDYSAQEDIYSQIKSETITLDIEHDIWYDKEGNVMPKPDGGKIPVAKVVDARLDDKGVWIKAELNQNLSKFNEVWGSIKEGFLKAFSIAFYPIQKAADNIVKRLNLVNITLTGTPVNPEATFTATMKSASAFLNSQLPTSRYADALDIDSDIKSEKNNMEETKMSEEIKQPETGDEVIEKPVEEVKTEEVKTEPQEQKVEEVTFNAEAEVKALKEELAELKAIKEEVIALKEENVKLKAELEKPVIKAIKEDIPKPIKNEYISPLNLI